MNDTFPLNRSIVVSKGKAIRTALILARGERISTKSLLFNELEVSHITSSRAYTFFLV